MTSSGFLYIEKFKSLELASKQRMLTKDKLAGAAHAYSHPPTSNLAVLRLLEGRDDKLAAIMFLSNVNSQIANHHP